MDGRMANNDYDEVLRCCWRDVVAGVFRGSISGETKADCAYILSPSLATFPP
jgi:hypothetical protein